MTSVPIAASTNGAANTLVAAVTGKCIRVLAYVLSFSGTVNAKFQSAVTPTDLSGLFYGVADIAISSPALPQSQYHGRPTSHFETLVGEGLTLNLSAGVAVGGYLIYELTPPGTSQQAP